MHGQGFTTGLAGKASKPPLNRYVAIKTIRREFTAAPGALERFRREAQLASRLKHPNIVTVYDYEEVTDGDSYIVTELIEGGQTLRDLLARQGSLPPKTIATILRQLAAALDYAHSQGVIHRDVKPANIFIENKRVVLGDFGIAKNTDALQNGGESLTTENSGVGTPDYMSPEQALGERLDHRSDIYSLGVILYEMLTGQKPFTGVNSTAIILAHLQQTIPRLSQVNPRLPQQLQLIVDKTLAKDRDYRYNTAVEVAKAFQEIVEQVTKSSELDTIDLSSSLQPAESPNSTHLVTMLSVATPTTPFNVSENAFGSLPATISSSSLTQVPVTPTSTGPVLPETFRRRFPISPKILASLVAGLVLAGLVRWQLMVSFGSGKVEADVTAQATPTVAATATPQATPTPTATPLPTPTLTVIPATATAIAVINQADDLYKDAKWLYNAGGYVLSADKLEQAIKLNPNNINYYQLLVNVYGPYSLQDYPKLEATSRAALKIHSNDPFYEYNLGYALSEQGNFQEAETNLRAAFNDSFTKNLTYALALSFVLFKENKLDEVYCPQ